MNRAVAFLRGYDERLVERMVPARYGRALLTPSLPRVYYLNQFSVDPGAEASAEELAADAEPIFSAAELGHRKVTVDDELGAALEPQFRAIGWTVEELLVMVHRGFLPDVDTSNVEEVEAREMEPIWEAGIRSDPAMTDDEEVRQLVAAQHRRRQAVDVRYLARRVQGQPVSYCELFSADGTAQIESVMTLAEFRGRGLAKTVVARAVEEARAAEHELTFLVASAQDWPKELYEKLGFEAVGSVWDFLRRLP